MGYQQSKNPGRKSGMYCGFRHMKTTQERRLWDAEFGRSKRSPCRLPEHRDDILRSDYPHRTWKRHRRHQWKP